jgi:L-2-hydroxycarboxylate dehydrogenase (NAD+)
MEDLPKQDLAKLTRISAAAITALIADVLGKTGLPPMDAAKVAELMTEADLAGADAHGVFRLPQYVRRLRAGGVNPHPDIRVDRTAPATALVDGDNGMGHLVMARAAATAIELAREAGVGWVGARRSNHAGAAGVYAAMPLAHDMVGIYSVVASANHMPIWGGAETLLGTNPLAIAIPAGAEAPVVLDIATTVVSYGTVKNYRLQGKTMPEGWMVDRRDGRPLTDPAHSHEGLLLPLGGYKGSGLALALGLLAGVLNSAAFGRDVFDFNANDESECNTGHFILALDIARFVAPEDFKTEVDRHLRDLAASRPLPGFAAIRLPGVERRRRRAERLRDGVPMPPELVGQLDALAAEIGIAPLRER